MHQWWRHTWRQAAVQYQWQYLATVYDEAFIQVFTVMVSYLLCAAVIIREDDQCYPVSLLWGGGGLPL